MLSQLGCVTLPADTLEKVYAGQALSAEEQLMYDSHPSVGQDLLAPIPRLETVAAMIAKQHEPCGEATNPEELNRQDAVTAGACILKAALDFDQLLTRGLSRRKAAKELSNQPDVYHPEVVASLQSMNTSYNKMITSMARLRDLRAGMILDEDINTSTGTLVIAKDHEVTYALMQRLRSYATKVKIVEPFRVRMPYYER